MKKLYVMAIGILLMVSCHSEGNIAGEEKGTFSLDLSTNPTFVKSKAVDVSVYQNVNNYTVELSKDGKVIESEQFGDMELEKKLEPGNYSIRAFYGENVPVGYDKLYVEGSSDFVLVKGDNRQVKLTCIPANVKVNVVYTDDFFDYYSECKVNLYTKHLDVPFVMSEEDVGKEAFFMADATGETLTITFALKDMQGVNVSPKDFGTQTVIVRPRDFLTITIKPKLINIDGGKIDGITVTIDGSVTSQDIPILIPDEYLPGENTEVGN